MGHELRIQWFVSRDDPDASLDRDANAMLSDRRCDLLAEYPLTANTLQPPRFPSAVLPPFDAITMRYGNGRMGENVVHVADAREPFGKLQDGAPDATVVDLRAFDAWRLRHESSKPTPSVTGTRWDYSTWGLSGWRRTRG